MSNEITRNYKPHYVPFPVISKHFITGKPDGLNEFYHIFINGSRTNAEINRGGHLRNIISKREIVPNFHNRGYGFCKLAFGSKLEERVSVGIHRILAALFIPIPTELLQQGHTQQTLVPNHKDGIKHHNDLDNLEWVTQKRNTEHAYENYLAMTSMGENSHLATITEQQAYEICCLLEEYPPLMVSQMTGVNRSVVNHIKYGESWKDLTKNFNFAKTGTSKPNTIDPELPRKVCELLVKKKEMSKVLSPKELQAQYGDVAIANQLGLKREYVKDIRTHRRLRKISDAYDFDID